MRLCSIWIVCIVVFVFGVSVPVWARGGAYIDDLVLRNNGTVVFSDNFDSGDLSEWHSAVDASVSSDHSYSADYSLYENWHGTQYSATISSDMSISNPGLLELSFKVWLPAVSEQWNSGSGSHVTGLYAILHSNTTGKDYTSGLWLYPYDSNYRMYLNGQYQSNPSCASGAWQNVVVSLDPDYLPPNGSTRGRAKLFLNSAEILSGGYSAADFPTIDSITIMSTFGDNQPVPEPSSLVVIATGLVFGLKLCKGRQSH